MIVGLAVTSLLASFGTGWVGYYTRKHMAGSERLADIYQPFCSPQAYLPRSLPAS